MSHNLLKICASLFVLFACLQEIIAQRTVCGPAIDAVLDTICENGFNTKFKRSMGWNDFGDNDVEDGLPSHYASSPFLAKIHGGQVDTLAKTRRRREGVYDECCRKPCTYNELYSYCM
ncbi:PREDICTED: probable insulin-like peptide 1 [Rhagoletis zephyria]|uniref:probable insulin-like peptide 1 n=1 Tax=Rhagoletis zephyria TaxID=28612 RepID=UPI000811A910|nr:PREDICTED: probable insulin-like peptide 1 [Rhagoletis zephyria]XP_036335883.1 probable insulin-like peptide 1 [Rhagoletis pomonella]